MTIRRVSTASAVWYVLGLTVATAIVYAPVRHYEFVNFDDGDYIYDNPHVATGLTLSNVRWAFANPYFGTGGPLTWLSHMVDVQLFGLNAGPHHVTSILLHLLNSVLLLFVLRALTGATGKSAFVAALFALHPLHVESVAWIAERKDVLSTTFFLLAIAAFARYVKHRNVRTYGLVLLCLLLGLLSKPMVATLPLVFLILDWWPLKRMEKKGGAASPWSRLIVEQLPLLVPVIIALTLTYLAQEMRGAVNRVDQSTIPLTLSNAVVSYAVYAVKMFWPSRLAVFYPFPDHVPWFVVALSAIALVAVSIAAVRVAKRYPYVLAGWIWYVITMAPVIGIIRAGGHARADRFTYIPLIGLFIIVTWGGYDLIRRFVNERAGSILCSVAILLPLAVVSRHQVGYWQNGVTLWTHAVHVTDNNDRAHANLGVSLALSGQHTEATQEYQEALEINPAYPQAQNNLAMELARQGKTTQAIDHYRKAIALDPSYANAHHNLGVLLAQNGEPREAIQECLEAVRLKPDFAEAQFNLALTFADVGDLNESIVHAEEAVRLKPDDVQWRSVLAELKRR